MLSTVPCVTQQRVTERVTLSWSNLLLGMPVVRNGPITAVENHQSGAERFISWFVLRYSFSLYLSFVAPCDLVYAMDCDVSKHIF